MSEEKTNIPNLIERLENYTRMLENLNKTFPRHIHDNNGQINRNERVIRRTQEDKTKQETAEMLRKRIEGVEKHVRKLYQTTPEGKPLKPTRISGVSRNNNYDQYYEIDEDGNYCIRYVPYYGKNIIVTIKAYEFLLKEFKEKIAKHKAQQEQKESAE